jgi:ketosteroid isomerase-like protein
MTAEEKQNIELVKRWEETYNSADAEHFVRECYTPDCVLNDGFLRGHEQFIKVEKAVLAAAPKRRIRTEHAHATGNVVVVEATLLDPAQGPDWKLPFCSVLTFRDGKIASDRTYAEFRKWPGLHRPV